MVSHQSLEAGFGPEEIVLDPIVSILCGGECFPLGLEGGDDGILVVECALEVLEDWSQGGLASFS
jgi:hypothetical protein